MWFLIGNAVNISIHSVSQEYFVLRNIDLCTTEKNEISYFVPIVTRELRIEA